MRRILSLPATAAAASWRVALLVLVTVAVWLAHFDKWTPASWQIPTDYSGDSHETLARLKAASEGELMPLAPQVIDRLGAPFGAHWNAYPTPDKPLMMSLGVVVHAIGVNAAANLGLLLAQVSAALAFYFVARWLGCRWLWAAAGALLFAYTYHTFHRGLAHFSLVFTWTVPLGLLAAWLVAQSRALEWRSRGALVCVVAAVALGASNPYNLFFWMQLMGWAVLAQFCTDRRRVNLEIGFVALLIAGAMFVIVNAEVWIHVEDTTAAPLLARNYGGTEIYALKPVEMFIPPQFHRWDWLALFGRRYVRWSEWRGEAFLPYLGIIGIAGFVWLSYSVLRAVLHRRPVPGQALSLGWLIAFATIGGVTNILAFFAGLQVFRATNRVAIFISAIVLLFVFVRLSRLSARWPHWAGALAALAITALGLFDEIPKADAPRDVKAIATMVRADDEFGRKIEAALPEGAMVFQLPVLGFPEVVPPFRLDTYEHFRPYLTTTHLRFSYGTPKLRSRIRWQRELEALPTPELVRHLERYGFAALYLNRKGYADKGEALLAELKQLGYTSQIQSRAGQQIVVLLHPAPGPVMPIAHSFALGQGWHSSPENTVRWAYDDAALSYFNPYPQPITVTVELGLRGVTPRDVTLELEGKTLQKFSLGRTNTTITVPNVRLAPGVNHFTLVSDTPAIRTTQGTLRSFGLQASVIKPARIIDPFGTPPGTLLANTQ